jgi:hypothetical protein
MASWKKEKSIMLLVMSAIDTTDKLTTSDNNEVVIPVEFISQAQRALEVAANLISVLEESKRKISSPTPCVALVPGDSKELAWLESTKGIRRNNSMLRGCRYKLDPSLQRWLSDRPDGVALIAEALAHDHPTGRFHELIRFFERAFALSSTKLVKPLGNFLSGSGHGYSTNETNYWLVKLRHPATHADKRDFFVLEGGIRPVVRRMKQAAYDVLLNKEQWRDPSTARRSVWKPDYGTDSADGKDIFVTKGRAATLEVQVLDEFSSYPMNLSAPIEKVIPKDWWTK